jgi:hypothetical protein
MCTSGSLHPAIQVTDCKEVGEAGVTHPLALQTTGRDYVDTDVSNLHDCSDTGLQPTPFSKDPSIDYREHIKANCCASQTGNMDIPPNMLSHLSGDFL